MGNIFLFYNSLLAFAGFSIIASSVYIFNDWSDRKKDSIHPKNKFRPIAAGLIKGSILLAVFFILLILGCSISYLVSTKVLFLVLIYLILNFIYSTKIKEFPIIDVITIALGFVIRLFVGSEATQISLNPWIIVITFLLALFLALAKRRDEKIILKIKKISMRKAMNGYNLDFLNASIIMTGSILLVVYILWSVSAEVTDRLNTNSVYLSSIFVVIGLLRYLQIIFVEKKSVNPTIILLTDHFIQVTLLGWVSFFMWLIYWS